MDNSKLLRMDNVSIVVESLDKSIAFFSEIGLTLEGRATIEGNWAGRVRGPEGILVGLAEHVVKSRRDWRTDESKFF